MSNQIKELANTIALQATAIAQGTVSVPSAQARLLLSNVQTLVAFIEHEEAS